MNATRVYLLMHLHIYVTKLLKSESNISLSALESADLLNGKMASMLSAFSYLHRRPVKPYNYTTVDRVATENAIRRPDQEIFIHRRLDGSRSSITNHTLFTQALQLGKFLVSKGVNKGDFIALIGPNTLQTIIGQLAIMFAGGVLMHVAIDSKSVKDAFELFRVTNTRYILFDSGENDELLPEIKCILQNMFSHQESSKTEAFVVCLRNTTPEYLTKWSLLEDILSTPNDTTKLPNIFPEDSAVISLTSGSTGKPKLVLHTHFSLTSDPFSLSPNESDYSMIEYNDRPFQWIGGSPISYILCCKPRVFMDTSIAIDGKHTEFIWNVIRDEKCTDAILFPYFILDLLQLTENISDNQFKLKNICTGGQIINSICLQVINTFCQNLIIVYGTTETLGITRRKPLAYGDHLKSGDVGYPYPGVEVRIADAFDNPVTENTIGQVQVRSPNVMKEYYGNRQLTGEIFTSDLWYKTGDVGMVTQDGSLFITGRIKDVISRGTRKIYPAFLEQLIQQMHSIKYVCVVAVPDRRLHEEICVCFVATSNVTPADVQKYCTEHLLTNTAADGLGEMPAYFVQFKEFPTLKSGKLDKHIIKAEAIRHLEL